MRKFIAVALVALLSNNIFAQTLQDAQKEIDRENFFKAKQILNGLLKSETVNKVDVYYYLGNAYLNSDHEIFLRELVSNAVDASQKFKTLNAK